MSRQDSGAIGHGVTPTGRLWLRRLSAAAGLTLLTSVAACGGDDDDAASSTDTPVTFGDAATTEPSEITQPTDSPATPGSEVPPDSGIAGDTGATEDSAPASAPELTAEATADATTSEGAATEGTEAPEEEAAADATGTSEATGDTSDGSTPDAGPTTTGAPCEFAENTSLPLERCNMGPAVAVVQSILQANGYEVGIDGEFGDQTLYAVRAFQEEEGLEVDGIVGLQTWTALDVSEYGTDANGDGVIAPDEIDLAE